VGDSLIFRRLIRENIMRMGKEIAV